MLAREAVMSIRSFSIKKSCSNSFEIYPASAPNNPRSFLFILRKIFLSPGNCGDRKIFRKMNKKLRGLFGADAGYISKELEQDFFIENERMLITASRANMKKLAADWQIFVLNLRMKVEVHFRMLKVCYGLVTSFPRSIDGYLTHYLAAITAHLLA